MKNKSTNQWTTAQIRQTIYTVIKKQCQPLEKNIRIEIEELILLGMKEKGILTPKLQQIYDVYNINTPKTL